MFGLGMPELLVILVIALLVFGAGRLPEIGNSLGRAIRGFKEASEKPEPEPPAPGAKGADRPCSQCGKPVPSGATFCPGCGKKLTESA
jgi:sec-independent protein translocase protein TatA